MSDFNKYIYHITANSACTVVKTVPYKNNQNKNFKNIKTFKNDLYNQSQNLLLKNTCQLLKVSKIIMKKICFVNS